jgi:hypothetical protein
VEVLIEAEPADAPVRILSEDYKIVKVDASENTAIALARAHAAGSRVTR